MISLILPLVFVAAVIVGIIGFTKKIKILKIVFLVVMSLFVISFSWIFYSSRTIHGQAFFCDSQDSPIRSCTYVSDIKYHYDSMDGAYYLEEINPDYVQFRFKANDCVLKSFNNKIGECKDTSGKSWAIILSGGYPLLTIK